MSTRELIEAVRDAEAFMGAPSVNGVRTPCACIRATDYDALRAATLAVLGDCIAGCRGCGGSGIVPTWSTAGSVWRDAACTYCANARALRERLNP